MRSRKNALQRLRCIRNSGSFDSVCSALRAKHTPLKMTISLTVILSEVEESLSAIITLARQGVLTVQLHACCARMHKVNFDSEALAAA